VFLGNGGLAGVETDILQSGLEELLLPTIHTHTHTFCFDRHFVQSNHGVVSK